MNRLTHFSIFKRTRPCFCHLKSDCPSATRKSLIHMYDVKFCVFLVFFYDQLKALFKICIVLEINLDLLTQIFYNNN